MDRLHQKGMIENPVGKAKSVVLTEKGLVQCRALFLKHFRQVGRARICLANHAIRLYRHGRHWKFKNKPEEESRSTAVNPAEVDAIRQWIRQTNPSLDEINSRAASR